ncbi:MAG: prepilin-type N-terminal cleavage/methylation domain-containing protein [Ruminococcus sp.]|nr:prepilin-type N-terminal cleavage/methylation domain-containing protein [Ruminococcus sp.]
MKKKGFTLIELIIVIAIIGILAGVLIPSWGYYMNRSKTRTQNLKAKSIFNAVQTFATDLKFAERRYVNILKDSSASNAKKAKADSYLMGIWDESTSTTEWCVYINGNNTGFGDPEKNFSTVGFVPKLTMKVDASPDDADQKIATCTDSLNRLRDSIRNIVDEKETVYKIYVKDYKVVSVVSSRFASDRYLGSYPKTLDNLEDEGYSHISEIREGKVEGADMSLFALDAPPEEPTTT